MAHTEEVVLDPASGRGWLSLNYKVPSVGDQPAVFYQGMGALKKNTETKKLKISISMPVSLSAPVSTCSEKTRKSGDNMGYKSRSADRRIHERPQYRRLYNGTEGNRDGQGG